MAPMSPSLPTWVRRLTTTTKTTRTTKTAMGSSVMLLVAMISTCLLLGQVDGAKGKSEDMTRDVADISAEIDQRSSWFSLLERLKRDNSDQEQELSLQKREVQEAAGETSFDEEQLGEGYELFENDDELSRQKRNEDELSRQKRNDDELSRQKRNEDELSRQKRNEDELSRQKRNDDELSRQKRNEDEDEIRENVLTREKRAEEAARPQETEGLVLEKDEELSRQKRDKDERKMHQEVLSREKRGNEAARSPDTEGTVRDDSNTELSRQKRHKEIKEDKGLSRQKRGGQETADQELSRQKRVGQETKDQELSRQKRVGQETEDNELSRQKRGRQETKDKELSRQKRGRQETEDQELSRQKRGGQENVDQELSRQKRGGQETKDQEFSRQKRGGQETEDHELSRQKINEQETKDQKLSRQKRGGQKTEDQELSRTKRDEHEIKDQELSRQKRGGQETEDQELSRQKRGGQETEDQELSRQKRGGQETEDQELSRQKRGGQETEDQELSRRKRGGQEPAVSDEEQSLANSADSEGIILSRQKRRDSIEKEEELLRSERTDGIESEEELSRMKRAERSLTEPVTELQNSILASMRELLVVSASAETGHSRQKRHVGSSEAKVLSRKKRRLLQVSETDLEEDSNSASLSKHKPDSSKPLAKESNENVAPPEHRNYNDELLERRMKVVKMENKRRKKGRSTEVDLEDEDDWEQELTIRRDLAERAIEYGIQLRKERTQNPEAYGRELSILQRIKQDAEEILRRRKEEALKGKKPSLKETSLFIPAYSNKEEDDEEEKGVKRKGKKKTNKAIQNLLKLGKGGKKGGTSATKRTFSEQNPLAIQGNSTDFSPFPDASDSVLRFKQMVMKRKGGKAKWKKLKKRGTGLNGQNRGHVNDQSIGLPALNAPGTE